MDRFRNWWRIEPGRNQLYDRLLIVFTHLHNYLVAPFLDYGFPVRVGPRVDRKEDD